MLAGLLQPSTKLSEERESLGLSWLAEHGDILFAFAMKRVSDRAVAEDLVQETFLAAIKNAHQFQGDSQAKTWLIGILRHKVMDHFRSKSRRKAAQETLGSHQELSGEETHDFARKRWGSSPESAFTEQEFWVVFERCKGNLPEHLREAFVLREIEDLETKQICDILGVKSSNLAVRIHRARVMLRKCLEDNWFAVD